MKLVNILRKQRQIGKIAQKEQLISVCLDISKIINWKKPFSPFLSFYATFVSPVSGETILEKKVSHRHNISHHEILFNAPMKISYTPDQKIIHLTIIKKQNQSKEEFGIFQIDLQKLKQKKKQYYKFGNQDNLLQIIQLQMQNDKQQQTNGESAAKKLQHQYTKTHYDDMQADKNSVASLRKNLQIKQKDKYVQNKVSSRQYSQPKQYNQQVASLISKHPSQKCIRDISYNTKFANNKRVESKDKFSQSSSQQSLGQKRLKKSFSEKVQKLLKEVKAIRQNTNVGTMSHYAERRKIQRAQRPIKSYADNEVLTFNTRLQHKVNIGQSGKERKFFGIKQSKEANKSDKNAKEQSNRHQLNLANLNIVGSEYCNQVSTNQQKPNEKTLRNYHQVYY